MTYVTKSDILEALRKIGIVEGDTVLFHSSLKSMGQVENGADDVIDAFLAAVGENGTVVAPTLSQKDFPNAYRDWTIDRPSDVGLITETFRLRPNAKRSDQATHSVAAIGRLADELTKDHGAYGLRDGVFGDTPFAVSSPWQKMYDLNAKIVFVGTSMRCNTFKHFVEYRVVEKWLKTIENKPEYSELKSEIRTFDKQGIWPFYDAEKMQIILENHGMIKKAPCGNAVFLCVNSKDTCDFTSDILEKDPGSICKAEVAEWYNKWKIAAYR